MSPKFFGLFFPYNIHHGLYNLPTPPLSNMEIVQNLENQASMLLEHFSIRDYNDLYSIPSTEWNETVSGMSPPHIQDAPVDKRGVMLYAAFVSLLKEGPDAVCQKWLLPVSDRAFPPSAGGRLNMDIQEVDSMVDFLTLCTLIEWSGSTELADFPKRGTPSVINLEGRTYKDSRDFSTHILFHPAILNEIQATIDQLGVSAGDETQSTDPKSLYVGPNNLTEAARETVRAYCKAREKMPWPGMWQPQTVYGISPLFGLGESVHTVFLRCGSSDERLARVLTGQTLLEEEDIEQYVTQRFNHMLHADEHGAPVMVMENMLYMPNEMQSHAFLMTENLMKNAVLSDARANRPISNTLIALLKHGLPNASAATLYLHGFFQENLKNKGFSENIPVMLAMSESAVSSQDPDIREVLSKCSTHLFLNADEREKISTYTAQNPGTETQIISWHQNMLACGNGIFATPLTSELKTLLSILYAEKYVQEKDKNLLIGLPIIDNLDDMDREDISECLLATQGRHIRDYDIGTMAQVHIEPVISNLHTGKKINPLAIRAILNFPQERRKHAMMTVNLSALANRVCFDKETRQLQMHILPEYTVIAVALLSAMRALNKLNPGFHSMSRVRNTPLSDKEAKEVLQETMRYAEVAGFSPADAENIIKEPGFSRILFGQTARETVDEHILPQYVGKDAETLRKSYLEEAVLYKIDQSALLAKIRSDLRVDAAASLTASQVTSSKPLLEGTLTAPHINDEGAIHPRPNRKTAPQPNAHQLSFDFY